MPEYGARATPSERKFVPLFNVTHWFVCHPYWADRARAGRPPTYYAQNPGMAQTYCWDRDAQIVRHD